MRERKTIRLTVLSYIEIETDLPVEQAMNDFELNSEVRFSDTEYIKVIDHEWMKSQRVSYTIHKTGKLIP